MMSVKTFGRLLRKISRYAFAVILHNWGEPFLNPDILGIIQAAKSAGVGTVISSNLNLAGRGDEFLRDVVDSGLDHLTVSIDGATQDIYATYRRGGNLNRVLHNLRELLNYRTRMGQKTPVVEWQFLVMRHNEHQIDEIKRLARSFGVDSLRFTSPGLPFDQLCNVDLSLQWLPSNKVYRNYDPKRILKNGYLYNEPCFYLYRSMTINPDGQASPCCVLYHRKWDFGNVLASDLGSIWNNEQYQGARSLFSRWYCQPSPWTACDVCPLFRSRLPHRTVANSRAPLTNVH